jgi:putative intracellular protease/amidase
MQTNIEPLKVGAVLFPEFELLDVYGPLEMLGLLRERVSITMLAEKPGEIPSGQGPKGVADVSLADVYGLDLLLVPGGWGTRTEVHNQPFLDLLRARAQEARFVASVCTGSALLARTGILDGKRATSNKLAFAWVTTQGPKVTWIREARWVEDGVIFTSSGVSAGMDMTLGLIERIFSRAVSINVARLAEYRWQDDSSIDPFAALAEAKQTVG